jgi:hypothetical protein
MSQERLIIITLVATVNSVVLALAGALLIHTVP